MKQSSLADALRVTEGEGGRQTGRQENVIIARRRALKFDAGDLSLFGETSWTTAGATLERRAKPKKEVSHAVLTDEFSLIVAEANRPRAARPLA